ncbi:MAG: family 16 glycosylhydrolase [Muribaculaceae bacterium]|nr:family 16 glycosylhydrolase [Muribaculaceae bacterium]
MNIFKTILSLFILSLTLTACGGNSDDPSPAPDAQITLSAKSLDFDSQGGSASVTVNASTEWDAQTNDSWISLKNIGSLEREGRIDINVENNSSRNSRTGTVIVICGTARETITINQKGFTPAPTDPSIEVPEGYELVWADEFNGSALSSDWTHEVQNSGWVNNELQNYVNGSFDGKPVTEVSDGTLKIHCFKASNGKVYSGRIYAKVNQGWKYGIFEARIKLPVGKGTWPAWWMMPANNDFNALPWPKCGEIDIMEEVGYHPNYTSSSIHCEAYNHVKGTQKTAERLTAGAQTDFHNYRLEWTEDYIRTYIDGKLLLSFTNDKKGNIDTWPFTRAFYPILNLAWGGSWGGAQGIDESCLPATMEVEYVRIFQKK